MGLSYECVNYISHACCFVISGLTHVSSLQESVSR